MGNVVERIREVCKEKGIAVSRMEADLGYGNGYLNPKKITSITLDRLEQICKYLDVGIEDLLSPETKKAAPEIPGAEKQLLEIFRQLDDEGKRLAIGMMKTLLTEHSQKNITTLVNEVTG